MKLKIGITIGLFIGAYIGYRIFLSYNPGIAYEWISGNSLPNGVVAVSYASKFNDNLFHSGHYWEFAHDETGMLMLLKQIGADDKYENYQNTNNSQDHDAIWVLSNIEKALGKKIPVASIGRGYELSKTNSRDSWLLINKNGKRSYYELN
jgi:hypothetical protein